MLQKIFLRTENEQHVRVVGHGFLAGQGQGFDVRALFLQDGGQLAGGALVPGRGIDLAMPLHEVQLRAVWIGDADHAVDELFLIRKNEFFPACRR